MQVGGFASVGARYGEPDLDLHHLDDRLDVLRFVVPATGLPVLVDMDDAYGDVKNVTYAVRKAIEYGAAGMFVEDQKAPKRCGQIGVKEVIPREEAVRKLRAADKARKGSDFFLIGRTDAVSSLGVDEAVARAEAFLDAGCDGVYVEGPGSDDELKEVGRAMGHAVLGTTMMEGGGKTPWHPPDDLYEMGYRMLFYPTTLLFSLVKAAQDALGRLGRGEPMAGCTLDEFEELTGLPYWAEIEQTE